MPRSTDSRWRTLVATLLIYHEGALAQSATPEDEMHKLLRVSEDVAPLGEDAFGEQISLYDGSTRFTQTDVSSAGQGPLLQLSRIFEVPDYKIDLFPQPYLANDLVDWSLDIPRLETLSAVYTLYPIGGGKPEKKWFFIDKASRCTAFDQAPDLTLPSKPGDEDVYWPSKDWWLGYQLHIPGQGKQDVLYRDKGNAAIPGFTLPDGTPMAFPAATKKHWRLGCLPGASNVGGDGFLAVSPDGTKYTLNWLIHKPYVAIGRPGGGGFVRRLVKLMATRVEDRFGNALSYSYDSAGNLVRIEGTDGRKLALSYEQWSHGSGAYPPSYRLSSATLQPDSAAPRTWRYGYTTEAIPRLASVVQPDNSLWTFNTSGIRPPSGDPVISYLGCNVRVDQGAASASAITMTAPSGLAGRFDFKTTVRGRGGVQYACLKNGALGDEYLAFQNLYTAGSISKKTYSGAGIGTQTWQYAYSPPNESWDTQCGACESETWTDVTDPAGNGTRSVFSNRADVSESRLKRTEYFAGGIGSALIRRDTWEYAAPDRGPWPARLGSTMQYRMNEAQNESLTPVVRHEIAVDGNRYVREVGDFDAFGQDLTVTRSNDVPGQRAKIERTEWINDAPHWVIGLPGKLTSLVTGETVWQRIYDPLRLTLAERHEFGRRVMAYRFNGAGQLEQFTDGNGNATEVGGYSRGIPMSMKQPNGHSTNLKVDEFGQVTAIANQVGAVTSYAYDRMGRLRSITPPQDDSTAWNAKVFAYDFVGGSERGIDGPHWRRSVVEGERVQMSYYDVLMRPILADAYRADGALHSSVRTDYDWQGRTTFESYPFEGGPSIGAMGSGTGTTYDALGRPTRVVRHSEQGDLVTTTEYLTGAGRRVSDPRGNQTTTWLQVFDDPASGATMRVKAPEGIEQTISRDIHAFPLSITQGGAGGSIQKKFIYDEHHRLCRYWEPEAGSTIYAHDAADNLVWSASGASFDGVGCGQDVVAPEAKVVRQYDLMNRLSMVAPFGMSPLIYSRDPVGNITTAASGGQSGAIFWRFSHNRRGLLTSERLDINGFQWTTAYGFDGNGAVSWAEYPDGEVVSFAPDAFGRPTQVGDYLAGASYFPNDAIRSFMTANGGSFFAERNDRWLLSNFTYGISGVPLISEDLAYDRSGNISSITDLSSSGQRTKRMEYDGVDRLTSAASPGLWGVEAYTYDSLSNLRRVLNASGVRDYQYDSSNLLRSVSGGAGGPHEFRYDERGNLSGKNEKWFQFDRLDRLVKADGDETYTYDAFGQRVKKDGPGGTTYYAYGSSGKLLWEVDERTKNGTKYLYLGRKLIAKATENIDVLKPKQVRTQLSVVGVPRLSSDGKYIETTLDILNEGTRPLHNDGQYPVRLGYHLANADGTYVEVEAPVSLPHAIPIGGHDQVAIRVASAGVLGTGAEIRFSLMQHGVAWFEEWPNNRTAEIGPYSTCLNVGDGRLCNNVTGLKASQLDISLRLAAEPRIVADAAAVEFKVEIANQGNVTLSPVGPLSVRLIAEFENRTEDATVALLDIPEIPPGEAGVATFIAPAKRLADVGEVVRMELVQGERRLADLGAPSLSRGPYLTPIVTVNADKDYSLRWTGVEGITHFVLDEWLRHGQWYTVLDAPATSWTNNYPSDGETLHRLKACHMDGCFEFGKNVIVNFRYVPSQPSSPSLRGMPLGPLVLNWYPTPGSTHYVVLVQRDGGAWEQMYDGAALEAVLASRAPGKYTFKVRACNEVGCSPFSASRDGWIVGPPMGAPTLSAGGISRTGNYRITWSDVERGATYQLRESANGGAPVVVWNAVGTSWDARGRSDGAYTYDVRACNAAGCGPISASSTITVAIPPPLPVNVRATYKSINPKRETLTLFWAPTPRTSYYQVYDASMQEMFAPNVPVGAQSLLLESGEPPLFGHAYLFRACNSAGCSDWVHPTGG